MRSFRSGVLGATCLALALLVGACGGGSGEGTTSENTTDTGTTTASEPTGSEAAAPADGPTITVGSFNFTESVILAEIYAQAMEDAGYPVETKLDLGSRELIFPSLQSGEIDFLPEYVGSALAVGFGVTDVPTDTQQAVEQLEQQFEDVAVLEPAPGEDKNVFVVTQQFAQENDVQSVSDLANVEGQVILGGAPECQERSTCYAGLVEQFGLDNLEFRTIQEPAARLAALQNGDIQVSLAFSTQPVIKQQDLVVLEEDTAKITPPENIIPVINQEVLDAYGEDLRSLINSITEKIETDTLIDLNTAVEVEAQDPAEVARTFLEENGFLGGAS